MRKFFTITTGFFFTFLFTACTQYNLNVETYLSYWASEAYVKDHAVKALHHTDAIQYHDKENILCMPSANDVAVTLRMHNPKHFPLVMPTSPANAGAVIRFPDLDPQPEYGAAYTLEQTAPEMLRLVYKKAFLQAYEWGSKDIGAEITLSSKDGRPFKQKYRFKIRANTLPPKPNFTVAKTKGSPAYYVLCITVPDMDNQITGGLLHKDLSRIEINGTSYPLSVNTAEKRFEKPASDVFITQSNVEKLSDSNADELPLGGWVLYYKTDAEVKAGAAKKDYTIRLADEKGLVSAAVNASTKPNRPKREELTIVKGTVSGSGSGTEADPVIIATDSTGAEIRISSETAQATVHTTLTDMESGTAADVAGNTVTVKLPLNGAGEKKYKLEYYTDGEGFTATPSKTVYYKVAQGFTVTFKVEGGNGSLKGASGTQEKTATTSEQTFSVLHGGSLTFTAEPETGYEVDSWSTNVTVDTSDNTKATLSSIAEDKTVMVQFSKKQYRVEFSIGRVPQTGLATIEATVDGGTVTSSSPIVVEHGKKVEIKVNNAPTDEWDIIWTVNGQVKSGSSGESSYTINPLMEDTTVLVDFTIAYPPDLKLKQDFSASDTALHTLCASEKNYVSDSITNKRSPKHTTEDTVLVVYNVYGSAKLSLTPPAGSVSLSGTTVKYKLNNGTEQSGSEISLVNAPGKDTHKLEVWLEKNGVVGEHYPVYIKVQPVVTTYSQLIYSVRNAPATTNAIPIHIGADLISSTSDTSDMPWIQKKLKIKSFPNDKRYTIDKTIIAPTGVHSIFPIEAGGELTLENLTLKGGKDTLFGGGALRVYGTGKAALTNCTIESCSSESDRGGGIYIQDTGTLTLTSVTIKNCTASGSGGAVYSKSTGTVTMTDCIITGNESQAGSGGGIYVDGGSVTINGGTISNNKVTSTNSKGGGICFEGTGTLRLTDVTVSGCSARDAGGGVYSADRLTMKNCTITGNECTKEGGGIYVGGTATMTSGSISLNTVTGAFGGGICARGSLTLTDVTISNNTGDSLGGGICVYRNANVTMNGGSITDNKVTSTSAEGGGAVVFDNSTLTLNNVQVSGNTAKQGKGVYVQQNNAIFEIQGSTEIKSNNDVFLNHQGNDPVKKAKITVNGTLSKNPVATITVTSHKYAAGAPVLTGTAVSTQYSKFRVTPKNGQSWSVNNAGKLQQP